MKKLLSLIFTFLFAFTINWNMIAEADSGIRTRSDSSVLEYTLIPENFGVEEEPGVIHPEARPTELIEKTSFPDRYDARDLGIITEVKDQKPYDLCWAESVLSMAESNLIQQGLADEDLDLSEIYAHYFQWHRVSDPLGLTKNDKNIWTAYESYPGYIREWINSWGSGYRAVLLLSSGFGIAPESIAPYPNAETDISNYSLDPKLAWNSDLARLDTAYWISMKDTEAVKRMIMKYGSAVIAFNQTSSKYLNTENGAYYCPERLNTNHLVNVIGWDNDYPAQNFLTDPGTNGAWLIKNSFGSDWGNNGYGWISYNDQTLSEDAFVFNFSAVDPNEKIYQYDGTVSYDYLNDPDSYEITTANVFTAVDNELLKKVGFITPSSYFTYTIKIYRGVKTNPESGVLYTSQKGSELYAGYHTIELDDPVELSAGDRFAIVVEIVSDRKGGAFIMADRSVSYSLTLADGNSLVYQEFISDSNAGESFYKDSDGNWIDCWNKDAEKSLGNVRIKAYTEFQSYSSIKTSNAAAEKTGATAPEKTLELYRMDRHDTQNPIVPSFSN